MSDAKAIRRDLGALRKKSTKEGAILDVIDDLLDLHVRLMDRVARLEARPGNRAPSGRPAREGTPGQRKEVNRDVAGKRTGEPKRTEKPTGRNSRKTTDIDRGII
jgi:hypothetical protein